MGSILSATKKKKAPNPASQMRQYMPVIPVFGRLRQENCEFKANLSYIVSSRPALASSGDPPSEKLFCR
jgi:hypothetical protein